MDQLSIKRIEQYWKYNFSCLSSKFETSETSLIIDETKARSGPSQIRVLRFNSKTVISLTRNFLDSRTNILKDILALADSDLQSCSNKVAELLGAPAPRVNRLFYAAQTISSKIETNENIRILSIDDIESLKVLEKTADKETWNEAGSCLDEGPIFGYFEEERLLSIAGFVPWAYKSMDGHRITDLANLLVYTSPRARKMGLGKNVVANLVEFAHQQGYIGQYQVDSKNIPSIQLATSLGFEDLGGHFCIRIG